MLSEVGEMPGPMQDSSSKRKKNREKRERVHIEIFRKSIKLEYLKEKRHSVV